MTLVLVMNFIMPTKVDILKFMARIKDFYKSFQWTVIRGCNFSENFQKVAICYQNWEGVDIY